MEEQQGTTSPNRTAQSNGFDEEWDPSLDVNLLKLDFDKMPPTQLLNENSASLVQSHIQEVANVGINHSSETEVQPANSNAQVEAHDTANIWTEGEGGSAESDAKVPKDLEEFHCFPRLPIELRCIIW